MKPSDSFCSECPLAPPAQQQAASWPCSLQCFPSLPPGATINKWPTNIVLTLLGCCLGDTGTSVSSSTRTLKTIKTRHNTHTHTSLGQCRDMSHLATSHFVQNKFCDSEEQAARASNQTTQAKFAVMYGDSTCSSCVLLLCLLGKERARDSWLFRSPTVLERSARTKQSIGIFV